MTATKIKQKLKQANKDANRKYTKMVNAFWNKIALMIKESKKTTSQSIIESKEGK
jgi:hypothetical protein